MSQSLPHGLTDTLLWSEELGYGWHPRPPMSYAGNYWDAYVERDQTPIGQALTEARIELVRRFLPFPKDVVDIGIGAGKFVTDLDCKGYDVNEKAIEWLKWNERYINPYNGCDSITCWDSLEHIPEPAKLLECVDRFVFVSMPVYKNQAECLKSKHYKPSEHVWYFSANGFIQYMDKLGFDCLLMDDVETRIGREGIVSLVFRRKEA